MSKTAKLIKALAPKVVESMPSVSEGLKRAISYATKIVVREGGLNKTTKKQIPTIYAYANRYGVILGTAGRIIRHDLFVEAMVRTRKFTAEEASKIHGEMQSIWNQCGQVASAKLAKDIHAGEYNVTRIHQGLASGVRTIQAVAVNKRTAVRDALMESGQDEKKAMELTNSLVQVGLLKA